MTGGESASHGERGTRKTRNWSIITKGEDMAKARIAPVHPGSYIKELLDEMGLSQHRLAKDVGVSSMRISHVVNGKRPVTAELALRLGRYFGQSPRYWLNLQSRYDMDMAEDAIGKRVAREVRPLRTVA
jgi:addiction module HigA family antidote